MTVQKILNNNLILATDEAGREQVVMGKGLRFFCRVGEELIYLTMHLARILN